MAYFKQARVNKVLEKYPNLTKILVETDDSQFLAWNFDDLTGEVKSGDRVIINTTAVELDLGSGGYHFVLWNLEREAFVRKRPGHIVKLRYTPLQFNCLAVEEQESPYHEQLKELANLSGMPVIIGTLHSQLAPAAAVTKKLTRERVKIAYLMTDEAALPMTLSNLVRELRKKSLIDVTLSVGQAFGGDWETINIFSGLVAAKTVCKADVAIVTMGIGMVGTGTYLGFSGINQGQVINAVHALKGYPIAIPRLNFKDSRPRHQGVSDQTIASLGLAALVSCDVPIPQMEREKLRLVLDKLNQAGITTKHRIKIVKDDQTIEALREYKLKVTTMGRTVEEEPEFFRAAGAAGYLAVKALKASSANRVK